MVNHGSGGPFGEYLQACRARISPEQAGLSLYGERRRVSGLRREEIAMLAGVSTSYYVRLEQGHSRHASPQVLDAIADALQLDDSERAHLHQLARTETERRRLRRPPPERPAPALLELLESIAAVPALVLGRRNDVLDRM